MYAVIVTGGKQYKVSEGDTLFVEKIEAEEGSAVTFEANIVKNGKAKKIYVFKMKRKKNERKKKGHRQPFTKVEITKINA